MDQDEPFINTDVFNVHDIAEIEGKIGIIHIHKILLVACCVIHVKHLILN